MSAYRSSVSELYTVLARNLQMQMRSPVVPAHSVDGLGLLAHGGGAPEAKI